MPSRPQPKPRWKEVSFGLRQLQHAYLTENLPSALRCYGPYRGPFCIGAVVIGYPMNDATLVAQFGRQSVTALTPPVAAAFVAAQEHLAAGTFNRRYAALQSFVRWCQTQGWLADDPFHGVERRPQPRHSPRALDPDQVETTLRGIRDVRDDALFWLIYDGGLHCNEALAINLEDIAWSERAIRFQGKGDHSCEMFFSRRVSRYLDDYLKQRGQPSPPWARCSSPRVKRARPAAPI
jgi:site-specific recombinase XerC